jgi:hypothetical protein
MYLHSPHTTHWFGAKFNMQYLINTDKHILFRKCERRRPLGKLIFRLEDNIKIDLMK